MLVLQMRVFVQQQPMLCQEVYGLQQLVLHLYCVSARALAAPGLVLHLRVCLQELCTTHGRVWLQEFCAAPGCVCLQELCAAPGRACLQKCLLHLCVSVYKSFVMHLDVSANKSAAQAVTVGVLLKIFLVCFGLFRNSSVCFGCFDIGSKHRNKPKYFVFGFTKQTETNAKQILFRFVSVRTEIYFCLFRGHPMSLLAQNHTVCQ